MSTVDKIEQIQLGWPDRASDSLSVSFNKLHPSLPPVTLGFFLSAGSLYARMNIREARELGCVLLAVADEAEASELSDVGREQEVNDAG